MTRPQRSGSRPVLAVTFGHRSLSPMEVAETASSLCDLVWLIDGNDEDAAAMTRLLRKFGGVVDRSTLTPSQAAQALRRCGVDGLVTYYDTDMMMLSEIAAMLDVPFHSATVAERLVDKMLQRRALDAAGIPVPRAVVVPPPPEAGSWDELAAGVSFPAVLKPRNASGSFHAYRVEGPADLASLLDPGGTVAGLGLDMFLEEYIPDTSKAADPRFADYLSVESVVAAGRVSHVVLTGRFPLARTFRETGFFLPAPLPEAQRDEVVQLADAAVRALGVETGCLHTEIKLTSEGPRVIEVNGRMGGGVPKMLALAGGPSLLEMSMRVALGEQVSLDQLVPCERIGYRFLFQPPQAACGIRSIGGLDRISALPGVVQVVLHYRPDESFDTREGTRAYVFSVLGSAQDLDELCRVERALHEQVVIEYRTLPTPETGD